jgi:hypothetical protein
MTTTSLDFTNGEFADNLGRASNLIVASKAFDANSVDTAQDVLRAAVVFLHASLEEVVRNLFIRRLPDVAPEKLNEIPLAGDLESRRPAKILLGSLIQFKGQFVENVIRKSIDAYVDTLNLNNTSQLTQYLELADVDVSALRKNFNALNELMQRRHQIVHQMDRKNELDPLSLPLTPLDIPTVEGWRDALESFVQDLFVACQTAPKSALQPTAFGGG